MQMFLFMAFNEPRILNQSTIKENKQGHLGDSEDHFKKSVSARSYWIHLNPLWLKVFMSILFVYLYGHTNTPLHKFMGFTRTPLIRDCLEMALSWSLLNSGGIECQELMTGYVRKPAEYSPVQLGGIWVIHRVPRGPLGTVSMARSTSLAATDGAEPKHKTCPVKEWCTDDLWMVVLWIWGKKTPAKYLYIFFLNWFWSAFCVSPSLY